MSNIIPIFILSCFAVAIVSPLVVYILILLS
jgi:hypothetical protein